MFFKQQCRKTVKDKLIPSVSKREVRRTLNYNITVTTIRAWGTSRSTKGRGLFAKGDGSRSGRLKKEERRCWFLCAESVYTTQLYIITIIVDNIIPGLGVHTIIGVIRISLSGGHPFSPDISGPTPVSIIRRTVACSS